jgi:hypothetical protein
MAQKGLNIYVWSYYITSGLLLPILAVVLHRVKGTKFRFITWTVTLLIISNVGALLFAGTNSILLDPTPHVVIWLDVLNSIGVFMKDGAFNEASWVFAHKYYTIARYMPFCIAGQEVPKRAAAFDNVLNKFLLVLNCLLPIL